MKKGKSFFVKMDPPKKKRNRYSPTDKRKSVVKDDLPPVNWQNLIDSEISGISDHTADEEYNTRHVTAEYHSDAPEDIKVDSISSENHEKKRKLVISSSVRKKILLFRLAAASIMFAAAILSDSTTGFSLFLMILSVLVSGYDLIIDAFYCAVSGNLLDSSVLTVLTVSAAFALNYRQEAVSVVILYQVALLIYEVAEKNIKSSAFRHIDLNDNALDKADELFNADGADYIGTSSTIKKSVTLVLAISILVSLAFAFIVPMLTYYRLSATVHRALASLLICTPASMLASMSSIGYCALCSCASGGIVFRNALTLEDMSNVKTLIIDYSELFNRSESEIIACYSEIMDIHVFEKLIYHIVYNSGMTVGEAFLKKYSFEYEDGIIENVKQYSDGIEAEISGTSVLFGTKSFFDSRGFEVPENGSEEGINYYLYAGGKYGGIVTESVKKIDIEDIIHECKLNGINRCILVTSFSPSEVLYFAENSRFDDVYTDISAQQKQDLISSICMTRSKCLIVTSDDSLSATEKDSILLIGNYDSDADAFSEKQYISSIPDVFQISRRIKQVALSNAIIAFSIKALIFFMCFTGNANMWIAMSGDIAAAVLTILISNRTSTKSAIDIARNRSIKQDR